MKDRNKNYDDNVGSEIIKNAIFSNPDIKLDYLTCFSLDIFKQVEKNALALIINNCEITCEDKDKDIPDNIHLGEN
jgi:hypothetical protein